MQVDDRHEIEQSPGPEEPENRPDNERPEQKRTLELKVKSEVTVLRILIGKQETLTPRATKCDMVHNSTLDRRFPITKQLVWPPVSHAIE